MNQRSSSSRKNNDIRSHSPVLRAIRLVFYLLQRVSPKLTIKTAFRLSFYTRKFPRPSWEHQIIGKACQFSLLKWRDGHIATWAWGKGPTILLIHGWEGRGSQLGYFIEPLVNQGFRVVTFDGPGHGNSTASQASLVNHSEALCHVAQNFGEIYGAIGHSMGAAALIYAAAKNKIALKRFSAVSSPIYPLNFYHVLVDLLGLKKEYTPLIIQHAEQAFQVSGDDLHIPKRAATLNMPALIVHDKDDHDIPVERGMELAQAWPNSELFITEGLGHRRILKDPQVIEKIVDFMKKDHKI